MNASDSPEVTSDEIIESEDETTDDETTDETTAEEITPPTLAESLDAVSDGSRLTEGTDAAELVAEMREGAHSVRLEDTRMTNAYKKLARAVAKARRHTLRPSGIPDWPGMTGTYNAIAERAYDEAFVGLAKADRKRLLDNMRAHLNRGGILEAEIRAYVGEREVIREDENGKPIENEDGTLDIVRLFPNGPDDTSQVFLALVRAEYIGQGNAADPELAIPRAYQSVEDKQRDAGSTPPDTSGPKSALAAAFAGVEGLKDVTPNYAAMVALRNVSDVVKKVTTGQGAVEDRPKVEDTLHRISMLAMYGAKYLDGKATSNDLEEIRTFFWSDEDEKYQSAS